MKLFTKKDWFKIIRNFFCINLVVATALPGYNIALAKGSANEYLQTYEQPAQVASFINQALNLDDVYLTDSVEGISLEDVGSNFSTYLSNEDIDKIEKGEKLAEIVPDGGTIEYFDEGIEVDADEVDFDGLTDSDRILYDYEGISLSKLRALRGKATKETYKHITSEHIAGAYTIGKDIKNESTLELLRGTVTDAFTDVTGSEWYAGSIGIAKSLGLADGYPDGTFKGTGKVTRIEFMTMLARATRGQQFYEIKALEAINGDSASSLHSKNKEMVSSWFGLLYAGIGPHLFPDGYYTKAELNQPISRYEVAWWVSNYGLTQLNKQGDEFNPAVVKGYFENVDEVRKVYFFKDIENYTNHDDTLADLIKQKKSAAEIEFGSKYVNPILAVKGEESTNTTMIIGPVTLEASGIVEGYPDGTFKGANELTRAEAITLLNRMSVPLLRLNSKLEIDDYFIKKVAEGVFEPGSSELPYTAVYVSEGETTDAFTLGIDIRKNLQTQYKTTEEYLLNNRFTRAEVDKLMALVKQKGNDGRYHLEYTAFDVARGGKLDISSKKNNVFITIFYGPNM